MPGPPPKPPDLRLIEGNPGHRPIRRGPTFSETRFGSPPKSLKPIARKLWRELVPQLEAANLSARVFRPALEGLCQAYQRAVEAEEAIVKLGTTFTTEKGYVGVRPEVSIAQKAWNQVRSFCQEFGLTPSAKGRIVVPKKPTASLKDKLMGRNAV